MPSFFLVHRSPAVKRSVEKLRPPATSDATSPGRTRTAAVPGLAEVRLLAVALSAVLALAITFAQPSPILAQAPTEEAAEADAVEADPTPDPRVTEALERLELTYEVDEDADYKLLFEVDDGRTQIVWIISKTEEYRELEVREIWSFAYQVEGGIFPGPVANLLLEDTFEKKLGAWTKIGDRAAFVTRLPADADPDTLYSTMLITLDVAEQMERRLTPDLDEF